MSRAVTSARGVSEERASLAPSTSASRGVPKGYFRRSEMPLAALVFLLPLVVFYEFGTRRFTVDPVSGTHTQIIAFNLLREFFSFLGASGPYLPALAVVGILLSWHIARNDSWRIAPATIAGMALESVLLAGPLWLFGFASTRYLPLIGVNDAWRGNLVLSMGAGIYEELIFRLIAFTLLHLLLRDVLLLPKAWANLLMVVVSALLFASYHYLGSESFQLRSFVFRTVAGAYFGVIFLFRGFGVTAGSHACYDIFVTTLRLLVH